MLTPILAHPGQPPGPHDLWGAWNLDPLILLGLTGAAWAYHRGWEALGSHDRRAQGRRVAFAVGLGLLAVGLVSPLDAMGGALASAHMVQHFVFMTVAPVLIALSAPFKTMFRGVPRSWRRRWGHWRRRTRAVGSQLVQPGIVWLAHAGAIWIWHATSPYEAALANTFVHIVEHATFFFTGLGFWWIVIRSSRLGRQSSGVGILLVFTIALQGVILSALLTFAPEPWYPSYSVTAPDWGLTALADQQLAGLIMWVPMGFFYVGAVIMLVIGWIRAVEDADSDAGWPARA